MFILSKQEMIDIDRYTIGEFGLPARILMEYAGYNSAQFIADHLQSKENNTRFSGNRPDIAVFSGHGNNGGDGLVIARCLKNRGFDPVVFFVGNLAKMSPETAENYELLSKMKISIQQISSAEDWEKKWQNFPSPGFIAIIDALFGIGFQGKMPELQTGIINAINKTEALKFAVDISSGVNAVTGCLENAFRADFTLTMAAAKYGHYLGKGREYSGRVIPIDIGIPQEVWQAKRPLAEMIDAGNIKFPVRNRYSHKGDYGRVAVIAGSPGFSGAAVLAAKAALHAGSGLITLFHQQGMETIYESNLLEVMTKPLPFTEDKNGQLRFDSSGRDSFSDSFTDERLTDHPAVKNFLSALDLFDVLLIGPGLGVSPLATALVNIITKAWDKPAIFDADALNILAHYPQWFKRIEGKPVILTPHIGEFARISQISKEEVMLDPIAAVKRFLAEYDCNLLLKGITRIFRNRSRMIFDISGNDALATGGSGDVLSGIIVSFLGQKLPPDEAAASASYLLGITAENCSLHIKTPAVTPSDIIDNLFVDPE